MKDRTTGATPRNHKSAMSPSAAAWVFELEADYTYNIRLHLPPGAVTLCFSFNLPKAATNRGSI